MAVLVMLVVLASAAVGESVPAVRHILVIHSYQPQMPWTQDITRAIEESLRRRGGPRVQVQVEFLDRRGGDAKKFLEVLEELYRRKYSGTKLSLLLAVDDDALRFVVSRGEALFGQVPVVFCGVNDFDPSLRAGPLPVTGVLESLDVAGTVAAIAGLQPKVRQLLLVTDRTGVGQALADQVREALTSSGLDLQAKEVESTSFEDMLTSLAAAPPDSAIVYLRYSRQPGDPPLGPRPTVAHISREASVPVYSLWDNYLGVGIVGGSLVGASSQGRAAGELARRVLAGEDAGVIPVVRHCPAVPAFDWHQLRRWGLSEGDLPAGSEVRFRPVSVWRQYRWYVAGVGALGLFQLLIIVALLVNRGRRLRAEEALTSARDELEVRVDERTAELAHARDVLERTNAQLEAANRELEAFSFSVSHDLRAPLRSIDGFSAAVLEDYGGNLEAAGRDYLLRVRRAAQHMGQLIDDLLELSRATRAEMSHGEVDLSRLAREIVARLVEAEPDRKFEAEVQEGLQVLGDQRLLEIVLTNLLSNGWKFTRPREVARVELGELEKEAGQSRGHSGKRVFYVKDNGVGLDMTYADKLFSPFRRLHRADEFPGSGVGLATVKRVVERHGGSVWVESDVDRGATFYFTL